MKLSAPQQEVLRRLAACDEPLAYFKGGYWTRPSIGRECFDREGRTIMFSAPWYVSINTVRSLEHLGLLEQTGSSVNYDIRYFPALSDRVLTQAGLRAAGKQ